MTKTNWKKQGVIFLNGVSSSGKTTIATALQAKIQQPCINWGIDPYMACFQPGIWENKEFIGPYWNSIIQGFHAAAAAMGRAGNLVIVDDVLEPTTTPRWQAYFGELFANIWFLFVGVHCPLDVIEQRERDRKDRPPDIPKARWQHDTVHANTVYDLSLDTSQLNPEECAKEIIDFIHSGQKITALRNLLQRH